MGLQVHSVAILSFQVIGISNRLITISLSSQKQHLLYYNLQGGLHDRSGEISKIPSRSDTKKLENSRKMLFYKKNRKKLGKRSRMYFAFCNGFRPILMVFIDQNMSIHDFSLSGDNFRSNFDDFETDFVHQIQKVIFF